MGLMGLIGAAKLSPAVAKISSKADDVARIGLRSQRMKGAAHIPGPVGRLVGRQDKTKAMAYGAMGIGAAAGVVSGINGTVRSINQAAGNPIGYASGLGVRNAFSGNPNDSRTKRGGASGTITLNSR